MSDNTNQSTNELLAALLKAQAQPQPAPQGAITFGGINKYWPQIVAVVAIGFWMQTNGAQQAILVSRVATLEESVKSIGQVKADQLKISSDMQVLQIDVTAVKNSTAEQAKKIDTVLSAVSALNQQVQSWAQGGKVR